MSHFAGNGIVLSHLRRAISVCKRDHRHVSVGIQLTGASRNRCGMRARGWHGVSFKTNASVPIQQIKRLNSLEQARTPQANNTALSPAEQPAAAGTLVEESVLKES